MTQYFLGVDVGNTKSHAMIADDEGQVLGIGMGGPGNHEFVQKAGLRAVLDDIIGQALQASGITPDDLAAVGYGIAGYDWSEDLPLMRDVLGSFGFDVPYALMNDSGLGLIAGSSRGWGVSVSAGTSVNARGRDATGREARMTGNSMLFAEYGGGSELVSWAVGAVSRAWTKRCAPTQLTDLFLAHVGAADEEDFLAGVARGRYRVGADEAPLVFQAAEAGDQEAIHAIHWLAGGLADIACGIIRQLEIEAIPFEVVLSGSIYKGSPRILETMQRIVCELAPLAQFVHLSAPPVTGAVMLAMEQVNLDYHPLRERIIATGEQMLAQNKRINDEI